jgi:VWFA-related protein
VRLNVSATGSGQSDLTADDFRLFDGGKAQRIVFLRQNKERRQKAEPLGSHEYSNRSSADIPRATLVLLDLMNARHASQMTAWNELVRALQQLQSGAYVYLYLLTADGGALYPVHELPRAGTELQDDGTWIRQFQTLDAAMRKGYRLRRVGSTLNERVRQTYETLGALALRLAAISGQKNLIWITHGLPVSLGSGADLIDYTPYLRQLSATLQQAGVVIYPVPVSEPNAYRDLGSGMESMETLNRIAALTGGRVYANGDISAAITRTVHDESSTYVLGYYPSVWKLDGKYRNVRVSCVRPVIRIQASQGYYAGSKTGEEEKAALDAAVWSPFDMSGIGLCAIATRHGRVVHVRVRIDVADVLPSKPGSLEITFIEYRAGGQQSAQAPMMISFDQRGAAEEGLEFARDLVLDDSVLDVRLVVLDGASNVMGSLTIPVPPVELSSAPVGPI